MMSFAFCFADESYTVKKGDTLYSLSKKYEITVNELRAANNLSENDVLKIGQKLVIPQADITTAAALSTKNVEKTLATSKTKTTKTVEYTVQKGDTLYGIARKNNIKVAELLALNNIDTSATIKIGQKILVPQNSTQSATKQNTSATETARPSKDETTPLDAAKSLVARDILWPLSNPVIKNINGKVSGVQLTGKDGEAVKAVREGTVMYTGVYRGFGEVLFVQSKTGLIYSYSGLKKVTAKKGEYVLLGDELGKIGKGKDASIKFMVFQNGTPLDPIKAPRG